MTRRIAIVGAGVAGLTAAGELAWAGDEVVVIDKGRKPAGRISTRRAEPFAFDHGAQYFTARSGGFRALVRDLARRGAVAEWHARIVSLKEGEAAPVPVSTDEPRWVGVPSMSAVATELAAGLDVRSSVRIEALQRDGTRWRLVAREVATDAPLADDLGEFDEVVLTPPAPQTAALLPAESPLRAEVERIHTTPCLAVLLGLEHTWDVPFDAAFVEGSPLAWIARNSSKPQRPEAEAWVLHASPEWSERRFDDPIEQWSEALVAELSQRLDVPLPPRALVRGFRWRFARSSPESVPAGFLRDAERGLTVCGDGWAGLRVEGAWTSGRAAARAPR